MSIQKLKKGFTLIELMVVIVIIGILAAIAIPKLFGMTAKAKASEVGPASGTWSKLQQAYSLEVPKSGGFAEIGYTPPGKIEKTPATADKLSITKGTTTNFVYSDEGSTEAIGLFYAANVQKLNDCEPPAAGKVDGKWYAKYVAADMKVTEIKIETQNLLKADGTVEIASGNCGSLTPSFGYLK